MNPESQNNVAHGRDKTMKLKVLASGKKDANETHQVHCGGGVCEVIWKPEANRSNKESRSKTGS